MIVLWLSLYHIEKYWLLSNLTYIYEHCCSWILFIFSFFFFYKIQILKWLFLAIDTIKLFYFFFFNLTYLSELSFHGTLFIFLFFPISFFCIELITIVRAANGTILHFRSSNDPNLVLDFHTTESCDICCRLLFTSNKMIEFLDEGKEIF